MKLFSAMILVLLLAGCMSDREYMLRMKNAKNAAAHPATFDVLTIKGPVSIAAGAELTTRAATQPFVPLAVPDGIAAQTDLAKKAIGAAVIGYGLSRIGDSGDTTTINNNAPAEGATP
jgi:hypothetical protein